MQFLQCPADQVLFGGSAGGGKSDALIGAALLKHRNSLLLRREYPQLRSLQDRLVSIFGGTANYRATEQRWTIPGWGQLELGSVPLAGDVQKFQGRAREGLLIDEATHFLEEQVVFLTGWLRSTDPDARPQLMMTSNPPTSGEGLWVLSWFRPWLDPNHPNPAKSGELRWFAVIDGVTKEVPNGKVMRVNGRTIRPFTRCFIKSSLEDNAYLRDTGYGDRLDALPEGLRRALRDGDWTAMTADQPLQCIPTAWVKAAMDRWETPTSKLSALGVDVSRGGRDRTVLFPRFGTTFGPPIIIEGADTNTSGKVASRVMDYLDAFGTDATTVCVDIIGVGSGVYDLLEGYLPRQVRAFNASHKATRRDPSGQAQFNNLRSQAWMSFSDALNPEYSRIALPPSIELLSELTSATYSLSGSGLAVESKEKQIARLGRSPDLADALIMAFHASPVVSLRN